MFCQKCNETIPDDSDFCPLCGEKLLLEEDQNESIDYYSLKDKSSVIKTDKAFLVKNQMNNKLRVIIVVLSVLLAVSLAMNIFFLFKGYDSSFKPLYNSPLKEPSLVSEQEKVSTSSQNSTEHIHDYKLNSTVDSSCDVDGQKVYSCTKCGNEYTQIITKSHSFSIATCTEAKKCTVCNETEGQALGHTSGAICSRCGMRIFETLHFSGKGRKVIKNINLPNGTYIITAKSNGTHNFIAWFHKSISDNYGNLIANSIGSSEEIYTVEGPCKDAYIEITESDGSWALDIELYE